MSSAAPAYLGPPIKIRRFATQAALLAWTPIHDGQYARALDTGNTWRYFAELGWVQQTSHDEVVALVDTAVGGVATPVQIYDGNGAPSDTDGNENDIYIDTASGNFYIKAGGTWGAPRFSMVGAAGAAGTPASYGFVVALVGSFGAYGVAVSQ